MRKQTIEYHHQNTLLEGVWITHDGQPRPSVLVSHTWAGRNQFTEAKA